MSQIKLNWTDNEARVGKYRIRVEQDSRPENPFEGGDTSYFPMAVYYDRTINTYESTPGITIGRSMHRMTPEHLIHDQHALCKAVGAEHSSLFDTKYCRDHDEIAELVWGEFQELTHQQALDAEAEICKLLGIPAYRHTSRGHSQSDWAEVLVIATPEAREKFGLTDDYVREHALASAPRALICKHFDDFKVLETKAIERWWNEQLKKQAEMYDAWAWGDVYGYIIDVMGEDEDGDEIVVEESVDSCWGFYGSDHAKSGLEDAVLEYLSGRPDITVEEKADA